MGICTTTAAQKRVSSVPKSIISGETALGWVESASVMIRRPVLTPIRPGSLRVAWGCPPLNCVVESESVPPLTQQHCGGNDGHNGDHIRLLILKI
jgi:hypothetical protein